MTFSGSFSAAGQKSGLLHLAPGESLRYALTVADTESFIGVVLLQSTTSGQAFKTEATHTGTVLAPLDDDAVSSSFKNDTPHSLYVRLICKEFDTDEPSDAIAYTLESVTEGAGVGSVPPGVSVQELGDGVVQKTVLSLQSLPVAVAAVTTGNGVGGAKIYEFPQGRILFLGCMAQLSVAIAADKQADFAATPEGDLGIGTLAPANADSLGTDATDDNFGTATAFDMASGFADSSVSIPSEAVGQFNGVVTPIDVILTALVDAADIDDGVTSEIQVSGTVTLHWINLGSF